MSPPTRRAPARLPSSHIDEIDKLLAQLRGLFGLLTSFDRPKAEPTVYAEDLLNLVWLLEDHLILVDQHAQALWKASRDTQQGGSPCPPQP